MARLAVGEVKTTTISEEVKPSSDSKNKNRPPFWDFVASLTREQWADHSLFLYRVRDNKRIFIEKYSEPLSEETIKRKHGGGVYNLLMKDRAQLIYNTDFEIEGEPRIAPAGESPAAVVADGGASAIARELMQLLREEFGRNRGGDLQNQAMRDSLELQKTAFTGALDTVKTNLATAAPAANPMEGLLGRFMEAMVVKMMNPADPIEQFGKMLGAVQALGVGTGRAEHTNMGIELVRALPSAIQQMSGIMDKWARASEAQRDMVLAQRGGGPSNVIPIARSQAANSGTLPTVNAPAASAAPANSTSAAAPAIPQAQITAPPIEWMETKIVKILLENGFNDAKFEVDKAAEDVLGYLMFEDENVVTQLLALGEKGVTQAFSVRPILAQVPQGSRLTEFIRKFIALAQEDAAAEKEEIPDAANPVPTLSTKPN